MDIDVSVRHCRAVLNSGFSGTLMAAGCEAFHAAVDFTRLCDGRRTPRSFRRWACSGEGFCTPSYTLRVTTRHAFKWRACTSPASTPTLSGFWYATASIHSTYPWRSGVFTCREYENFEEFLMILSCNYALTTGRSQRRLALPLHLHVAYQSHFPIAQRHSLLRVDGGPWTVVCIMYTGTLFRTHGDSVRIAQAALHRTVVSNSAPGWRSHHHACT
ncbi:hypothetical protein BZA05DRAFT_395196 [Tricharina praecox]|uniref:uncharacterized protein n=1 Tax=Tricharina praecox TaxID=43433 RepID=UPI00221FC5C6|nr:uncharacterized protein BZA05DRAFT_395196 [Tricharina praecox]KAI5853957.1 hypothetical protein BZA05DRAFT_395196 [Tricharina praecox]